MHTCILFFERIDKNFNQANPLESCFIKVDNIIQFLLCPVS